jgi:23S rRNA (adenine2503-C2)-methyltransferase
MQNISFEKIKIAKIDKCVDGTVKFLFELYDKNVIEMALIEFEFGYSGCASTQIGCNMGCKFCASGLLKKKRNLTCGEIIQEMLLANQYLLKNNKPKIGSLSFMGIGEPLDNYDNLAKAITIINDKNGIGLSMRSLTISTCGITDKINDIALNFPQCNLAISLHAPTNEIRNKIMPVNRNFNIEKIMKSVEQYIKTTNNEVTFQYSLMQGINDSDKCAMDLIKLLAPYRIKCHVTLIEYNPVKEFNIKSSKRANDFKKMLRDNRINATIRETKGRGIDAACGTMRNLTIKH